MNAKGETAWVPLKPLNNAVCGFVGWVGWVYSAWGSYSTCAMFYAFCGRGMCNVWSEQYKRWSAVHFGSETERKTTIPLENVSQDGGGIYQGPGLWIGRWRILRWFDDDSHQQQVEQVKAGESESVVRWRRTAPQRASSVTAFQTRGSWNRGTGIDAQNPRAFWRNSCWTLAGTRVCPWRRCLRLHWSFGLYHWLLQIQDWILSRLILVGGFNDFWNS